MGFYINRDEFGLWAWDRTTGQRYYIPDLYCDSAWDVIR